MHCLLCVSEEEHTNLQPVYYIKNIGRVRSYKYKVFDITMQMQYRPGPGLWGAGASRRTDICEIITSFVIRTRLVQGVKHSYFSYVFLFFSLNSFFSYFLLFFSLNSYFSYFFSDFKVKSGYGYVSQLYVRGMASLHLIYHPIKAEYKGQMSLEGSYWGEGWEDFLQHSGFVPQYSVFKGSVNLRHFLTNFNCSN